MSYYNSYDAYDPYGDGYNEGYIDGGTSAANDDAMRYAENHGYSNEEY